MSPGLVDVFSEISCYILSLCICRKNVEAKHNLNGLTSYKGMVNTLSQYIFMRVYNIWSSQCCGVETHYCIYYYIVQNFSYKRISNKRVVYMFLCALCQQAAILAKSNSGIVTDSSQIQQKWIFNAWDLSHSFCFYLGIYLHFAVYASNFFFQV